MNNSHFNLRRLAHIEYSIFVVSLFFVALCGVLATGANAQSRSYTTLKSVEVTALSNGVQLRFSADGLLQYRDADTNGSEMRLFFPDARNGTNKNLINVDKYPVSYVQLSTPQGAANGIGLNVDIRNLISTSANVSTSSDGQSVLMTIQSNRTVESSTRTDATSVSSDKIDVSTQVTFADGTLSLRAVRADIHEVIAAIAQKSGLSLAVDDAVNRKISLNLDNIAPEAALRAISTAYGLALSQSGGLFTISEGVPTDLATYNASDTQSFRMQNVQAQNVSGLLPNFLYSYVKVNSEQNAVVVTAPSQMLQKIGEDLRRMDKPAPQIAVEAIVVELSDATDRDLGVSFGDSRNRSFSSVDTGTLTFNGVGNLPRGFEFNLRALEQRGKARVRARPQMAVINGRTANIFIGAQRFIITQVNNFGQTQNRIQSVDVGVKLQVTPLTGGNGEITVRLVPEVSNITELDLQTGLPVLSSRRTETTVRVKDGETIAISGLTLDQQQTANRKIPFLGDLPLVGGLFRGKKRNNVRTELVVFVTPRILTSNNALPEVAAATSSTR